MSSELNNLSYSKPTESPLLGVSIDGSTISFVEISIDEKGLINLVQLKQVEENELLEVIQQFRHPIHNELNAVKYPNPEKLSLILTGLLESSHNDRNLLVSLSQECFRRWEQTTEMCSNEIPEIYYRGLKKCLHSNPYGYPILYGHSSVSEQKGMETWRFWSARFDDFLQTAEICQSMPAKFRGAVSPYRALAEVIPRIVNLPVDQPATIVHIGKLRTYYVGLLNGVVQFIRAIPVGISRDGPDYFQTLPPNLKKIGKLIIDQGSLIMSADTTPTALFSKELKSPRSEATRFAHQVGEFTTKVQMEIWDKFDIEKFPLVYMSGSVSRLKGLQDYLAEKTGYPFNRLTQVLSKNLHYDPSHLECCITDYLIPIGNCLAWQHRDVSRSGLILTDQRPIRKQSYKINQDPLENNKVYLIEYPSEIAYQHTPVPIKKK